MLDLDCETDNSKEYKRKTFQDSLVYARKTECYLLSLYSLVV